AYTIVGRDTDDVDRVHAPHAQPRGEADAARVPLEPRVRRRVITLREDRFDPVGVEGGVEVLARRTSDTVRRPRVDVVGRVAEVVAGVDVVVLGGHHVIPAVRLGQHLRDGRRDTGPAGRRERAARAEVVLYVDDDQRTAHRSLPSGTQGTQVTGIAGSPWDSFRPS